MKNQSPEKASNKWNKKKNDIKNELTEPSISSTEIAFFTMLILD